MLNKCVEYFINTENNTTRIRWNKTINLPFRYSDLYDENKQKKINSKWLNLPISKSKYIVKGLIHSDWCISKEVTFDTTSKNLIESLRYILLRMIPRMSSTADTHLCNKMQLKCNESNHFICSKYKLRPMCVEFGRQSPFFHFFI